MLDPAFTSGLLDAKGSMIFNGTANAPVAKTGGCEFKDVNDKLWVYSIQNENLLQEFCQKTGSH